MTPYGFAALENIEYEASIDLYRAAPEDLRVAHAIEVRDIGAATCLTSRGLPRGIVAGKPRVRASGRRGFRAAVHGRALGRIARGSGEVGLRPGVRRRHARRCGSRIPERRVRGARVAVTETGERQPDKPGVSYRNILRAGFQEMYLQQNYMSPSM